MSHISLRLLIFLHFPLCFLDCTVSPWSIFCWFFFLPARIYSRAPLNEVFILLIVHFNSSSQPLIGWRLYLGPLSQWCFYPLLLHLYSVVWSQFSQFWEFMSLSCVQPNLEAQMFPLLLLLRNYYITWASAQVFQNIRTTVVFSRCLWFVQYLAGLPVLVSYQKLLSLYWLLFCFWQYPRYKLLHNLIQIKLDTLTGTYYCQFLIMFSPHPPLGRISVLWSRSWGLIGDLFFTSCPADSSP